MTNATNTNVLSAEEQQLATLLADKTVPDSIKSMMAGLLKTTIEQKKQIEAAQEATRQAELKATQAKRLKEAMATGPFVYIEAPGISKKNQPYPAKVAVNPYAGAHPFYGQLKMIPNEWRELLGDCTDGVHVQAILKACNECDAQYPVKAVTK